MSASTVNVSDPRNMTPRQTRPLPSAEPLDRFPRTQPVVTDKDPHSPLTDADMELQEDPPTGVRGAIFRYRTGPLAQMVLTQHPDVTGNPKGVIMMVVDCSPRLNHTVQSRYNG
ncbi:hypothetical protein B0H17DRAFT_1135124 [Mycena rosella]|uniref:Uncharacterized protein n=1 Tax=Mycena rosella TaxID=1033263 RepID=A0AAD7DED1_MYCRO|nr:hypothetical protein B0H17DRAFT_1135124 [Mycena rosella]